MNSKVEWVLVKPSKLDGEWRISYGTNDGKTRSFTPWVTTFQQAIEIAIIEFNLSVSVKEFKIDRERLRASWGREMASESGYAQHNEGANIVKTERRSWDSEWAEMKNIPKWPMWLFIFAGSFVLFIVTQFLGCS